LSMTGQKGCRNASGLQQRRMNGRNGRKRRRPGGRGDRDRQPDRGLRVLSGGQKNTDEGNKMKSPTLERADQIIHGERQEMSRVYADYREGERRRRWMLKKI
jgi:hypothetical protein